MPAQHCPAPAPTHCQHRPQERQPPAPAVPRQPPSPPAVPHPRSARSRQSAAVVLRASRRICCPPTPSRDRSEGEGREEREGKKEQPQHMEAPASQHIPNPARLPILPAPAPPVLRRLHLFSWNLPDGPPPCLLLPLQFCFWRENRTPPPKPPNLHGNRGPATCQRPPAMIGGGHLTFSTFCHIYDMTPVPSSTHLLSNPNSARFTVRSYRRTNSWIRSGRTPHILHHFITNTPVFHNITPVIPR